MIRDYTHIASLLWNKPLVIAPGEGQLVSDVLRHRMYGGAIPDSINAYNNGIDAGTKRVGSRPYTVEDGIAIIEVNGKLVTRGDWIGASSGVTSYDGIAAQLRRAQEDKDVLGIMMVWNSPGGQATQIQDTANLITNSEKPVWSIANYMAASGAYWLPSASTRFASVADGMIGSIGVVWMHADHSVELAKQGVNVTVIQAGARKTDGNPFQPLAKEASEEAESIVSEIYGNFVSHVAASRGISEQAVRDTEARVFGAKQALKLGLIDEISTVEKFHQSMAKAMKSKSAAVSGNSPKGKTMSDEPEKVHTAAELTAAKTEAHSAGSKEGAAIERKRIGAILGCDAAKTRPQLAIKLATSMDVSAEQATDILATAQPETPAATAGNAAAANPLKPSTDLLAAAMKGEQNPTVGSDVEDPAASGKPLTDAEKAEKERVACEAQFGKPLLGIR